MKKIEIKNSSILNRITLFNGKSLLITDCEKCVLYLYTLESHILKEIDLKSHLKCPRGLVVLSKENGNEEIYILDYVIGSVFVFNEDFKLVKKCVVNLIKPSYMSIDSETKFIYVSHSLSDEMTIWDSLNGNLITRSSFQRPLHSKIAGDILYLVSMVDCSFDPTEKEKLLNIKAGNFVSLIHKTTMHLLKRLNFVDGFDPRIVHVTSVHKLWIIAKDIDRNKRVSKNFFLFKINAEHEVIEKVELKDISSFNDVLYVENKIVICGIGELYPISIIKIVQLK